MECSNVFLALMSQMALIVLWIMQWPPCRWDNGETEKLSPWDIEAIPENGKLASRTQEHQVYLYSNTLGYVHNPCFLKEKNAHTCTLHFPLVVIFH